MLLVRDGDSEAWVWVPMYLLVALACAWYTGSIHSMGGVKGPPYYLPGWLVRLTGWFMLLIWPILELTS